MKSNLKQLRTITAALALPVGYAIGRVIVSHMTVGNSFGSVAWHMALTFVEGYALAYIGIGIIASFFYRTER